VAALPASRTHRASTRCGEALPHMQASLVELHARERNTVQMREQKDQGTARPERGASPLQGRPDPTPPPAA